MSVLDADAYLNREPGHGPQETPQKLVSERIRRLLRLPLNATHSMLLAALRHPYKRGYVGDTINQYGVHSSLIRCTTCGNLCEITPRLSASEKLDPANLTCGAPPPGGCASYDPHRDASFLLGGDQ